MLYGLLTVLDDSRVFGKVAKLTPLTRTVEKERQVEIGTYNYTDLWLGTPVRLNNYDKYIIKSVIVQY